MKLTSLIIAISSASVLTNVNSWAIAEAVPKHSNNSLNRTAKVRNDSATNRDSEQLQVQISQSDRSHLKSSQKSISYNIFSVAKDLEITLENAEQDIDVEDVEWYIEKY